MSQHLVVVHRPFPSAASAARFFELVKKNETSPSPSIRKRKAASRKTVRRAFKEQKRYARTNNLRAVALTLTWADNGKFKSKRISAFLDKLRRAMKQKGFVLPYLWTLECEGRLHYHLLLWLPRDYKLDPAKLEKWWSCGSTWVESCRSPEDWARYIAKFNSIAKLPKGVRSYGSGGLDDAGKEAVLLARLPPWLVRVLPAGHLARRVPGGGWADLETGEIYLPPWSWTPWGMKPTASTAGLLLLHLTLLE